MVIDILLAIAFLISAYILWQRLRRKIPELIVIPDKHISELLEENTEKLQRFFLHIFHFRSFYRERHYHERIRRIMAKLFQGIHIALLWLDNKIINRINRMHEISEKKSVDEVSLQEHSGRIDLSYLREEREDISLAPTIISEASSHELHSDILPRQEIQTMQEVKSRRSIRSMPPSTDTLASVSARPRKTKAAEMRLIEK